MNEYYCVLNKCFIIVNRYIRSKMAKRTKKVGICGKYAGRYGSAQRKAIHKIEVSQHARYTCAFCGKVTFHHSLSFLSLRTPSREELLVSGTARAARRLWLEEPTCLPPPPLPLLRPPSCVLRDLERTPRRRCELTLLLPETRTS